MSKLFVVGGVGLLALGCGGSDSGSLGAGGRGSGGSDGDQVKAMAGLTLAIQGAAQSCPVQGKTYRIGAPEAPTRISPGNRVVNGESGADISCSVHGTGPFAFSGSLHAFSSNAEREPVTVTFSNGNIDANKMIGTATVSVFSPTLAGTFTSASGACTVNVISGQVKDGSIWAAFSCPNITAPPASQCAVSEPSVIVFENCDGS